jgi:hypothetical protein
MQCKELAVLNARNSCTVIIDAVVAIPHQKMKDANSATGSPVEDLQRGI